MDSSTYARLRQLRAALSSEEMHLGPALLKTEVDALRANAVSTLGVELPEAYLDLLSRHDGFAAAGVFLYSSTPYPYPDGGSALAVVEMNVLARELEFMNDYLLLGDSDMDCYVYVLDACLFQVRDKVVFDNVYETFSTLDGLVDHMIDLIDQGC